MPVEGLGRQGFVGMNAFSLFRVYNRVWHLAGRWLFGGRERPFGIRMVAVLSNPLYGAAWMGSNTLYTLLNLFY